jgi:hypothetical protein
MLHLLGLDDNRLTDYHVERFKQLSQLGREVIHQLGYVPKLVATLARAWRLQR